MQNTEQRHGRGESASETQELTESQLEQIDGIMSGQTILLNGEVEWDYLKDAIAEGVKLVGQEKFRELFDKEFGEGASRYFMKERGEDQI